MHRGMLRAQREASANQIHCVWEQTCPAVFVMILQWLLNGVSVLMCLTVTRTAAEIRNCLAQWIPLSQFSAVLLVSIQRHVVKLIVICVYVPFRGLVSHPVRTPDLCCLG